jgi:hypothetical protein
MHRYYTTAATRQALIEASNRLIAARAATHTSRRQPEGESAAAALDGDWPGSRGDTEASAGAGENPFAWLVSELSRP